MYYVEANRPGTGNVLKSLALHLLVLALLVLAPQLKLPKEHTQQAIQAYVVQRRASPPPEPVVAAETTPPAPQPSPRVEPAPTPRPKPRPAAVKLPKAPVRHQLAAPAEAAPPAPVVKPAPRPKAQPHPAPTPVPPPPVAKPKPKPRPARPPISADDVDSELADVESQTAAVKQQQRQHELDELRHEADASMQALNQSANKEIVEEYKTKIMQQIRQQWRRPLSARNGMTVVLHIRLLPGGEVSSVDVISSSGDPAFDASAQNAVSNASPLAVPDDTDVFSSNFRSMTMKFHPEDLAP